MADPDKLAALLAAAVQEYLLGCPDNAEAMRLVPVHLASFAGCQHGINIACGLVVDGEADKISRQALLAFIQSREFSRENASPELVGVFRTMAK